MNAASRVCVRKDGGVWTWWCDRCMWSGWTRLGFTRALDAATSHQHWILTEMIS